MRFRLSHSVTSFLATALMASLLVGPISAQAASASSFQTLDIPSGWECEMAPKGFLDILGILNDVEYAQYSDRISTISQAGIAQGSSLSSEDYSGVSWTMRQLAACANSMDPLRVLPLLSDHLLATLIANVEQVDEIGGALETLTIFATETIDQGGVPVFGFSGAWYDERTTKRIWAVIEVPVTSADVESPNFLVSFIFDEYMWIIDSIWTIES